MTTLCVDTASDKLSVAVTYRGKVFTVVNRTGRGTTSSNIIGCIDNALSLASLALQDADYIGAVIGPGSFTGIRIGISVINAFHLALRLPLISVTAFEALSFGESERALCLIDARHDRFYGAVSEGDAIIEQKEYTLDEANAFEGIILTNKQYDRLTGAVKVIADEAYAEKCASVMLAKARRGATVPYLIPLYMKLSQAERNEKRGL